MHPTINPTFWAEGWPDELALLESVVGRGEEGLEEREVTEGRGRDEEVALVTKGSDDGEVITVDRVMTEVVLGSLDVVVVDGRGLVRVVMITVVGSITSVSSMGAKNSMRQTERDFF